MHTNSLDITTCILREHNHLNVATSLMNVAIIYEAQGKYEEALKMHKKSLDIKTRILGGDSHPSLGYVLQQHGQYLRGTRQLRGGARTAREIARHQDPHL